MKQNLLSELISHLTKKKLLLILAFIFSIIFFSSRSFAGGPYYFHTIHSHGLSLTGGRTGKISYLYQMNHKWQLKVAGTYVYDSYDQERNHIKTNIYNFKVQFQYNLINKEIFFLNLAGGGGGYFLKGKDLLNLKYKEWKFDFVGGLQAEFYIISNKMALTIDYDVFWTPWSGIYEFLHAPTAGITFFFF